MNKFYHATALNSAESVKLLLADPIHWKKGRSAYELAHSWIDKGDIPSSVRAVLDKSPIFRGCILLEGFFEHETPLRSAGGPTHSDLLAVLRFSSGGLAAVAVEGKAGEDFGPLIRDWNDGPGKQKRLASLCTYFGLDSQSCGNLRYQLLHRTAAAMFEAERYGAKHAMMLVHSFGESKTAFQDYREFTAMLGAPTATPDEIVQARTANDIELSFGWVKDSPQP